MCSQTRVLLCSFRQPARNLSQFRVTFFWRLRSHSANGLLGKARAMARHQPRFVSDDSTEQYSWFRRVIDNLLAAFHISKCVRSTSSGAPLHFADTDLSARHLSAQTYVAIVHATVFCATLPLVNSQGGPFTKIPTHAAYSTSIPLRIPHMLQASAALQFWREHATRMANSVPCSPKRRLTEAANIAACL